MKSFVFNRGVIVISLILILASTSCTVFQVVDDVKFLKEKMQISKDNGVARLEHINDIPVLHLYGSPAEMGTQYGTLMKDELLALFDILDVVFSEKRTRSYKEFADSVDANMPKAIKEEIKAISRASGVGYWNLVAFNMLPRISCSTLAVWDDATPDGNLIMGRNADYNSRGINDAAGIIIVRHPNNGVATLSVSYLGMVGAYTGMTENGLSYGNMLVYNAKNDDINYDGISIQLVMRLASEKAQSAKDMVDNIHLYKHMIPINVMCADNDEAFLVELDQEDIVVRSGEDGALMATNLFIDESMTDKPKMCHRYRKIKRTVDKYYGEIGVEEVKEAMFKARRKGGRNIQCIIFEPIKKRMHVSINKTPASKGPFDIIDIERFFQE